MTEEQFQQSVIELAQIYHWRVYHTRDSRRSEPGFPDLVAAHEKKRRMLMAELKSDSKRARVSPDQVWWLVALANADVETYLWTPADLRDIHVVLRSDVAPPGIDSRVVPAASQPSSALAVPLAGGDGESAGRGVGAGAGDARASATRQEQGT